MTKKIKLSTPDELLDVPLEAASSSPHEEVEDEMAAEVDQGGLTRSSRRLSRRVASYAEGGKRRRTRKSSILGTLFSPVYQFYQTISGHPTGIYMKFNSCSLLFYFLSSSIQIPFQFNSNPIPNLFQFHFYSITISILYLFYFHSFSILFPFFFHSFPVYRHSITSLSQFNFN